MPGSGGGNDFKSVVCDEDEQDNTIEWRPNVPTCISKTSIIYGSSGKMSDWRRAVAICKIMSYCELIENNERMNCTGASWRYVPFPPRLLMRQWHIVGIVVNL